MPLNTVLSVRVRPERTLEYEELVRSLAEKAREKGDPRNYTTHQNANEFGTIHFVSMSENWTDLQNRGNALDLVQRVMGDEAPKFLRQLNECFQSAEQTVSIDRPDLSYPPEGEPRVTPAAIVTRVRIQPGGQEAVEELIRKAAEAIPKVGDAARILTFQTLLGDLAEIWTVRPLERLSELDQQRQLPELLNQAFGAAEGGLIFRSGQEAIRDVQRQLVIYREDLSHPQS